MYPIDERDNVIELSDAPKPCGGAPMPFIVADEDILLLSYFTREDVPSDADKKTGVAIVQFQLPIMHLLGPPNEEAIRGHPLWRRGLESYGTYRVEQSSLLRRIAAMNCVHPRNDPAAFDNFHHYIVTFHDSTFECIARSYTCDVEQVASEAERYERMLEIVKVRDERWRSGIRGVGEKPPLSTRLRWWASALNPWAR
ncbi:MAG TPA: hypothetical protein VLX58_07985 [Bryobacteraceae bacterium]|nr:hypothetical protein [Bryobacteraceae bacterium]